MTTARTLALFAAALALSGCASRYEKYTYKSVAGQPQTVSIEDWTTGETVWSYEVPVGRQLNIRFLRKADVADSDGWDEMRWNVGAIGESNDGKASTMRVPPPSQRRVRNSIRETPEARLDSFTAAPVDPVAGSTAPAPAPASKPAAVPEGVVLPDPKQPPPK